MEVEIIGKSERTVVSDHILPTTQRMTNQHLEAASAAATALPSHQTSAVKILWHLGTGIFGTSGVSPLHPERGFEEKALLGVNLANAFRIELEDFGTLTSRGNRAIHGHARGGTLFPQTP